MRSRIQVPGWFWLWASLCGLMLLARPALPIDETRYLGAAWEMWWRESFAVPYVNGAYYDGKPPLFFWLMHAGWAVFGVSDWWARLLAPAFGLASLALVRATAMRLWEDRTTAEAASWILLGSLLWAGFCASTMFDMLLGFFALLSVYAAVRAWRESEPRYFLLAGVALGLGILAKGPVVFLPILFLVAFAPWWMPTDARTSWRRWYRGALGAAAVAALIALAWLVPMALGSDRDYLLNMTVKQTVGYTVDSFSHARPFWWYLPLLPALLFPWALWPRAWLALAASGRARTDPGVRLCLLWIVALLVTFSLFSGKQAHYLLLFFPAVALLLARLLPRVDRRPDRTMLLPALVQLGLAALLIAGAQAPLPERLAPWLSQLPAAPLYAGAAALLGFGIFTATGQSRELLGRIRTLAIAGCAVILVLVWTFMSASGGAYDVRPMSAYLGRLEANGAPLAAIARYDGQYLFYGRMKKRVEVVSGAGAAEWARLHPEGYVLAYYHPRNWPPTAVPEPARVEHYRGGMMVVWRASDLVARPQILETFE